MLILAEGGSAPLRFYSQTYLDYLTYLVITAYNIRQCSLDDVNLVGVRFHYLKVVVHVARLEIVAFASVIAC